MVRREIATLATFAVAAGMFVFARSITLAVPLDQPEPAARNAPAPVAVAAAEGPALPSGTPAALPAPRTPAPAPATHEEPAAHPAAAASAPDPANTGSPAARIPPAPVPAAEAPPVQVPAAEAPPEVIPAPEQVAAPTPSPAPVVAKNPDDSPERTKSGKVHASTDTALPPAIGPADALVHVLVFSDFQCPVCRRAVDATHQIAEEWPGEVRVELWQHALEMHRSAEDAAVASLAAHVQGKFWEYHDLLFENQRALDPASLTRYAQQLGLDMERFARDFAAPALRERVQKEGQLAQAMGARGTPAFSINGELAVGWGSWNGFRGQVERELGKARETGKKGAEAHLARLRANLADEKVRELYEAAVVKPRHR